MKKFYITMAGFLLVVITGIAYSQDKPGAKNADPEKIELTAEQTKQVTDSQKDAQLAALQVENLQLKIQQAQEQVENLPLKIKQAQDELKKIQESAQTKQKALAGLITNFTKLPVEKLSNYNIEEKDGKLVLTKK